MTSAGGSGDYNEALDHFVKLHIEELEVQANKLAGCYGIDCDELLSRTLETVWKKWASELCALPDSECFKRTPRILYNQARNLSKSARRSAAKCSTLSSEELERLTRTITRQDPVAAEAIFEDERLTIYKAISQLHGACRDVMSMIALGLDNDEIRQVLNITMTNLTSTKLRARKQLDKILGRKIKAQAVSCK